MRRCRKLLVLLALAWCSLPASLAQEEEVGDVPAVPNDPEGEAAGGADSSGDVGDAAEQERLMESIRKAAKGMAAEEDAGLPSEEGTEPPPEATEPAPEEAGLEPPPELQPEAAEEEERPLAPEDDEGAEVASDPSLLVDGPGANPEDTLPSTDEEHPTYTPPEAPPAEEAPAEEAPAVDDNVACPDWAANGQCAENVAYMKKHCAMSCASVVATAGDEGTCSAADIEAGTCSAPSAAQPAAQAATEPPSVEAVEVVPEVETPPVEEVAAVEETPSPEEVTPPEPERETTPEVEASPAQPDPPPEMPRSEEAAPGSQEASLELKLAREEAERLRGQLNQQRQDAAGLQRAEQEALEAQNQAEASATQLKGEMEVLKREMESAEQSKVDDVDTARRDAKREGRVALDEAEGRAQQAQVEVDRLTASLPQSKGADVGAAKSSLIALYSVFSVLGEMTHGVVLQVVQKAFGLEPPMNIIAFVFSIFMFIMVSMPGAQRSPVVVSAAASGPVSVDLSGMQSQLDDLKRQLEWQAAASTSTVQGLAAELKSFQNERGAMDEEMLLSTKEILMWLATGENGSSPHIPDALLERPVGHFAPPHEVNNNNNSTNHVTPGPSANSLVHTQVPPPRPTPEPMSPEAVQRVNDTISRISAAVARAGVSTQQVFEKVDLDHNGRLSRAELEQVMCRFQPDLSALEKQEIFQRFDQDSNGSIDIKEFSSTLERCRPLPEACVQPASTNGVHSNGAPPAPAPEVGGRLPPTAFAAFGTPAVRPPAPAGATEPAAEPAVQPAQEPAVPEAPPAVAQAAAPEAPPAAVEPPHPVVASPPQVPPASVPSEPFGAPAPLAQQESPPASASASPPPMFTGPPATAAAPAAAPSGPPPSSGDTPPMGGGPPAAAAAPPAASPSGPPMGGGPPAGGPPAGGPPSGGPPGGGPPAGGPPAAGAPPAGGAPPMGGGSPPMGGGARPQQMEIKAAGNPFGGRPQQQAIQATTSAFGARPQQQPIQASTSAFGARPQPKEIVANKSPFG